MTTAKLKWFRRGLYSALSAGRSILPPAINFAVAYLVIQLSGQSSWGQFVEVLIFTSLANMFIAFGIKDYVLRQASLQPGNIGGLVKSGILVRLVLLVPFATIGFIVFPAQQAGWLSVWLVSTLVYSGLDALINFNRSYVKAISGELVFGAFLFVYLTLKTADQTQLVMAFATAAFLRSAVLLIFFRKNLIPGLIKFDLNLLVLGLPFLAIGFSGMLQSKTDLYLVAALLGDEELAVYQVTINFFIYLQALSALVLLPFVKNVYRLPENTIWKISVRFTLLGLVILAASLPAIYWATNYLYNFGLDIRVFLIGGLFVIPSFMYLPMVYKLIGIKKEKSVLATNIFGVLANLIVSYLLIQSMGLIGGFIGSMISQWAMLVGYYSRLNKSTK
jgi:O-antigen/teichoic acid export membrane protein